MKLEHLLEFYKTKNISTTIKTKVEKNKSGVIEFSEYIYGTYYLFEDSVVSMHIYADLSKGIISNIEVIRVISHTIDGITNNTETERNKTLEALGMFDMTFTTGKQTKYNGHGYRAEMKDNLFVFTIGGIE